MRKIALASAAIMASTAIVGVQAVTATSAHADPCFFGGSEFSNWYNGARWGATVAKVDSYAACPGTWETWGPDWKGNPTKARVWPRSDGGQTRIVFALTSGAYHSHDQGQTRNADFSSFRRECEWPRPSGNPCSPA